MTLVDGDEEVLATGSGLPRWTAAVAVLAAAGLAVGVLIGSGHPRHAARPQPTPTVPVVPAPAPVAVADVAIGPTGSWAVENGALVDQVTGRRTPVPGLAGNPLAGLPRIVVDPVAPRVWVVIANGRASRLTEFAADTGRQLRDVSWAEPVRFAAAFRGALYLTTDRGAAVLAGTGRTPVFVPGLSGAVGDLAADPVRHRLVLLDLGKPTDAWTLGADGRAVEADQPLPLANGTVGVVDGAIWVAGYGAHGAVLDRLDPRTLRPTAQGSAAATFGSGAQIVGTGTRLVWLGVTGDGNTTLSCVDAATGRLRHAFDLPTVTGVASDGTQALVASSGGLLELPVAPCGLPDDTYRMLGPPISRETVR